MPKEVRVAVLLDASGPTVVGRWASVDRHEMYAVMDTLGSEGWLIGPDEWVELTVPAGTDSKYMPRFLRSVLQGMEGLPLRPPAHTDIQRGDSGPQPPASSGYYRYPLRRLVREEST